jgi:hypothetical protein
VINKLRRKTRHGSARNRWVPGFGSASWQRAAYPSYPSKVPVQSERLPATACTPARRRTFAIISHPDAGKTTLTEKLLLFGGAIQLADEVKARRAAAGALGLDGGRARARHLGLLDGDELRALGARLQPPRHAGSPGFQPTGISARTPTAP